MDSSSTAYLDTAEYTATNDFFTHSRIRRVAVKDCSTCSRSTADPLKMRAFVASLVIVPLLLASDAQAATRPRGYGAVLQTGGNAAEDDFDDNSDVAGRIVGQSRTAQQQQQQQPLVDTTRYQSMVPDRAALTRPDYAPRLQAKAPAYQPIYSRQPLLSAVSYASNGAARQAMTSAAAAVGGNGAPIGALVSKVAPAAPAPTPIQSAVPGQMYEPAVSPLMLSSYSPLTSYGSARSSYSPPSSYASYPAPPSSAYDYYGSGDLSSAINGMSLTRGDTSPLAGAAFDVTADDAIGYGGSTLSSGGGVAGDLLDEDLPAIAYSAHGGGRGSSRGDYVLPAVLPPTAPAAAAAVPTVPATVAAPVASTATATAGAGVGAAAGAATVPGRYPGRDNGVDTTASSGRYRDDAASAEPAGAGAAGGYGASWQPYSYSYSVGDSDGVHSHSAQGDTQGRVTGEYSIQLTDGRSRVVKYTAGQDGYRADIVTNELGTESKNPADVTVQSSAPTGEEASRQFTAQQQLQRQQLQQQQLQLQQLQLQQQQQQQQQLLLLQQQQLQQQQLQQQQRLDATANYSVKSSYTNGAVAPTSGSLRRRPSYGPAVDQTSARSQATYYPPSYSAASYTQPGQVTPSAGLAAVTTAALTAPAAPTAALTAPAAPSAAPAVSPRRRFQPKQSSSYGTVNRDVANGNGVNGGSAVEPRQAAVTDAAASGSLASANLASDTEQVVPTRRYRPSYG